MMRSAIYIDVEGTSKIYPENEAQFLTGFDRLLGNLIAIGDKVFPESPDRLFAHQVGGDGIIVVSESGESSAERFISIAVILMRVLLAHGLVGKCGISKGTFGDIRSCLPSLRDAPQASNSSYRLGDGLLTTLPVMGTALINSHRYAEGLPRGSRLAVDPELLSTLPVGVVASDFGGPVIVDWIHTKTSTTDCILQKVPFALPPTNRLEELLVSYVRKNEVFTGHDWGKNTLLLNGC